MTVDFDLFCRLQLCTRFRIQRPSNHFLCFRTIMKGYVWISMQLCHSFKIFQVPRTNLKECLSVIVVVMNHFGIKDQRKIIIKKDKITQICFQSSKHVLIHLTWYDQVSYHKIEIQVIVLGYNHRRSKIIDITHFLAAGQ